MSGPATSPWEENPQDPPFHALEAAALVIWSVTLINGVIGFVQDDRAESWIPAPAPPWCGGWDQLTQATVLPPLAREMDLNPRPLLILLVLTANSAGWLTEIGDPATYGRQP